MERYRVFNHTADLGIEVYGKTVEDLFSNAVFALFDLITDLKHVHVREVRRITVSGDGWDDLLVNFLREVLYLFNGERFLVKTCVIKDMREDYCEAELRGEMYQPETHTLYKEIKAVTYHQIMVKKTTSNWMGRVIFDV